MPTILLVDDDAISRYVLKSVLEDRDYSVLSATPQQALRIAAVRAARIDLLVTNTEWGAMGSKLLAACWSGLRTSKSFASADIHTRNVHS